MRFAKYFKLKKEYEKVFDEIFESYYAKGYFGESIDKSMIKKTQFKWFSRLAEAIDNKEIGIIEETVSNHNNKITRGYFSSLVGQNINRLDKEEIIKVISTLFADGENKCKKN